MAATRSATLIGSASATRKISLAARSEASASEMAVTKLSSASSDEALALELRAPVDIGRLRRVLVGDGVICREPGLRPHRRDEHEPFDLPARSLCKLAWRFRVDAHIERIGQQARRMRDAGEVHDMRHAGKHL